MEQKIEEKKIDGLGQASSEYGGLKMTSV